MDELHPTSHCFVSQGLALNYVDWGNPDAPLLLLVHGGRDHARSWDWVARALRDDWHVICPDLRGHGDSAWSPGGGYQMPAFVADLAQLVRLCSDGPVSIVGHSMGGAISLMYTGTYPERVRRLAVIEGVAGPSLRHEARLSVSQRWRDWIEERRTLSRRPSRRYATLAEAVARMHEGNPHLSPAQALHLTTHGVYRDEDGSYGWKFDYSVRHASLADVADQDLHELWRSIECPVWLVHGADSWAPHPAEEGRVAHFRQATVTDYERAGHWLHHDRFDSFVTDLRAFLAGAAPGS